MHETETEQALLPRQNKGGNAWGNKRQEYPRQRCFLAPWVPAPKRALTQLRGKEGTRRGTGRMPLRTLRKSFGRALRKSEKAGYPEKTGFFSHKLFSNFRRNKEPPATRERGSAPLQDRMKDGLRRHRASCEDRDSTGAVPYSAVRLLSYAFLFLLFFSCFSFTSRAVFLLVVTSFFLAASLSLSHSPNACLPLFPPAFPVRGSSCGRGACKTKFD